MLTRPDAQALLLAARTASEELAAARDPDVRRTGAMIARAIGIACAQLLEGTENAAVQECARIAAIYDPAGHAPQIRVAGRQDNPQTHDLHAAQRHLVAGIRAGQFPFGTPAEIRLRDYLLQDIAHKLRIINVKYMARRAIGPAESSV